MDSGSITIRQCPNCQSLIGELEPVADNSYDARYYSDGKMVGDYAGTPNLVKCYSCNKFFWLKKTFTLGKFEVTNGSSIRTKSGGNIPEATFLSLKENLQVLKSGFIRSVTDELYVRQQICWLFNDRLRANQAMFFYFQEIEVWRENNLRFLDMLDPIDSSQVLMMAELFRYLGDFKAAIEVMGCVDENDYQWLKPIFIRKCKEQNMEVFLMGKNVNFHFIPNRY
jgi:hypothetical protein